MSCNWELLKIISDVISSKRIITSVVERSKAGIIVQGTRGSPSLFIFIDSTEVRR